MTFPTSNPCGSVRAAATTMLADSGRAQVVEDAAEIGQILRSALADCRLSKDMRARVAACLERTDRIARNTEYIHKKDDTK